MVINMAENNTKLNVKSVMNKGEDKKRSMNAMERAVFSAYKNEIDESQYDGLEVDTTGIDTKERAESLGLFKDKASWIHFLHNKVDFDINQTKFKGKESYQVRGGIVEIGQGLVLDMNSVTLIGLADNRAYTPNNEKVQFVYFSRKMNEMYGGEVETEAMTKAEAKPSPDRTFHADHIPNLHGTIQEDIKLNPYQRLKSGAVTITEKGMVYDKGVLIERKNGKDEEKNVDAEIGLNTNNDTGIEIRENDTQPAQTQEQEEKEEDTLEVSSPDIGLTLENSSPFDTAKFLHGWSSDYVSAWQYLMAFVKKDTQSKAGKRLQWVMEALDGIMQGKIPEELTQEQADEMGIKELPDDFIEEKKKTFPIFPWLDGYISLEPDFKVGVDVGVDLGIRDAGKAKEKAGELVEAIMEKNDPNQTREEKEQGAREMMMNFLAVVEVDAGVHLALKGSLSATVALGVIAGLGSLINARSGLTASLALSGQAGDDDELLKGSVLAQKLNLKEIYEDNIFQKIMQKGFKVTFEGGIGISASIGGEIVLESEIFDWYKYMDKDFVAWNIARVKYMQEAYHEPGASLFDITFAKSALNASAFGKSLNKQSDSYGFTFSSKAIEINKLVKKTQKDSKETQEIIDAFSVLENKNLNDITPEDLSSIKEQLIRKQMLNMNRKNELQKELDSKELQENVDKNAAEQEEKIAKHQERLTHMEAWKQALDTGQLKQGTTLNDAYAEYSSHTSGAKGMKEDVQEQAQGQAEAAVATRLELLDYEKKRQSEIRAEGEEHIAFIRDYVSQGHKWDEASEEFVNMYIEHAGDSIGHVISRYASVDKLKEYEEGRTNTIGEKHKNRLELLKQKADELNLKDKMSEKNEDFLRFYRDELKGKRVVEDPFALGIDIDTLVDMEIQMLEQETTGKYYDIYRALESVMSSYKDTQKEEERKYLDATARNIMFQPGMFTFEEYKKYAYRSASADELIEYEQNKTDEVQAQLLDKANGDKKSLLKSVDRDGVISYFFSNKNREEVIEKNVEIDTLLDYELERAQYYLNQDREEEGRSHLNRYNVLLRNYTLALQIDDTQMEKRQEMLQQIRDDYFSGAIDAQGEMETTKKATKKNRGFLEAAAGGKEENLKYIDRSITQALVDRAMGMSQKVGQRVHYEDLMKLKELKDQHLSDAEIWAVYKDRSGGKKFKEKYLEKHAGDKLEDITAPQLYRYMANMLGKQARDGWFTRTKMEAYSWTKTKAAGMFGMEASVASSEEMAALLKAGGLQRLRKLLAIKDEQKFQEMEPEERRKWLADYYKNNLQGDNAIRDYYKKHAAEYLTPDRIIQYEQDRYNEKTAKHQNRLKLLNDNSKTDEQKVEEYRLNAMEDGNELKDKFNFAWSLLYKNYETGADKALKKQMNTILTPASALDFEETNLKKISLKHEERIKMLSNPRLTDQEAWESYTAMGGGRSFKKSRADKIAVQKEAIMTTKYFNGNFSYDQIRDYEQDKLDNYKNRLEAAKQPLEKLKEQIRQVSEHIEVLKRAIEKCRIMKDQKIMNSI